MNNLNIKSKIRLEQVQRMNRRTRRHFGKENGIKIIGTTKPLTNVKK